MQEIESYIVFEIAIQNFVASILASEPDADSLREFLYTTKSNDYVRKYSLVLFPYHLFI